jgi:hypothetical protein
MSLLRGLPRFSVSPNPVKEGGTVTVKGPKNGVVYVIVKGKKTAVKLDGNGSAKIKEPVGADKTFTVSDFHPDGAQEVEVSVVASFK